MSSLRPPFKLWPLHWHALLACAVVVVAALAGWSLNHALKANREQLQLDADQLAEQLRVASHPVAPSDSAVFMDRLASRNASEDVARDIARFGQDLGVQITSVTVDARKASSTELGKVQFSMTARADYASAKSWINELLARYRSLAVQSLSLQTNPTDAQRQDLRLILVLYVKD